MKQFNKKLRIPKKIEFPLKKLISKSEQIKYNLTVIRYIKLSKYFDKTYYLNTYKDITTSPYKHYYETGWKERKNPSIKFDTTKYLENNKDIEKNNLCPLYHFEKYGKKEGRKAFFVDSQFNQNYKTKTLARFLKRKINNIRFHKLIKKNKDAKILVYIHIFYIKSIPEIIEYLKNLEKYNYDLIISCNKNNYEKEITNTILNFKKDATIYSFPNKGYVVGPFIEVLNKTDLNKYDIIFKLQSKDTFTQTIFVYNQLFKNRDLFEDMYESTLGSSFIHKNIDLLLHDKKIGIIAAKNLIIKDPPHKRNFTINILEKHNLKIHKDYSFVAGTCYASKIELAKKIKKQNITLNNFESANKGYFSFNDAMERYITGHFSAKYILYGNSTNKLKKLIWKNVSNQIREKNGTRIILNKKFKISDDFSFRFLEHTLIDKYYIKSIKISDIKREYKNKQYNLKDCSPYHFLLGDTNRYINYCINNRRTDYMSLSEEEFIKYVKKNCIRDYKKTIAILDKNGYDYKNPIIIDQNNNILDGQHRACYLLYKYGENHKIKVLKLHINNQDLNKLTPLSKLKNN